MRKIRKNCKKGGVAEQVEAKTNLTLIKFCELNGLYYRSVLNGYFSKKTLEIFAKYGIKPLKTDKRCG